MLAVKSLVLWFWFENNNFVSLVLCTFWTNLFGRGEDVSERGCGKESQKMDCHLKCIDTGLLRRLGIIPLRAHIFFSFHFQLPSNRPLHLRIPHRNLRNSLLLLFFPLCCDYFLAHWSSTPNARVPYHLCRFVSTIARPPHSVPSAEITPSAPSTTFGRATCLLVRGCGSIATYDMDVAVAVFRLDCGAGGER